MEAHHLFAVPVRANRRCGPPAVADPRPRATWHDGAMLAHIGPRTCGLPISYALHSPAGRASTCRSSRRPRRRGRAHLRAASTSNLSRAAPGARGGQAGGPRPASSTPPTRSRSTPSSTGSIPFTGIAAAIERVLDEMPAQPVSHFDDLFAADAEARRRTEEPGRRVGSGMNWVLIFLGFSLLIVLHEAGHFFAAKATGMRVERFFLFFPPKLVSIKRGETEYGIGAIPAGGFVKISGMNPDEELPPEAAHRGYYAPAGLEANRRDRRRPRGQHRPRLRDPLCRRHSLRRDANPDGGRRRARLSGRGGPAARRRDPRRRRHSYPDLDREDRLDTLRRRRRLPQMRRQAGRRLQRPRAR